MTSLGEIRVASLRDEVTRALRAAIASGEIEPGQVYSAPGLAQRLGVSVTPVARGDAEPREPRPRRRRPNRGFCVRPVTPDDLEEVLELRGLVEVPLLARAAGLLGDAAADEARQALALARRAALAGDAPGFVEHDRHAYEAMLRLGGNAPAQELLLHLCDYAGLYGLLLKAAAEARPRAGRLPAGRPGRHARPGSRPADRAGRARPPGAATGRAWAGALAHPAPQRDWRPARA